MGLETGLEGGSVSILHKEKQIDFALGEGNVSRSEDLLPLIENLLKKNGLPKRDIELIAVSNSPGSLTGIRIGLAIAKGLGDALSARVCKYSVLEAMALLSNFEGRLISALYTEKSGIYFKEFEFKEGKNLFQSDLPVKADLSEFIYALRNPKNQIAFYVLNGELMTVLRGNTEIESLELINKQFQIIRGNFAEILGRSAFKKVSLITK